MIDNKLISSLNKTSNLQQWILQTDGNFVAYGTPIWHTGTYGNLNPVLDIDTGKIRISFDDRKPLFVT